MDEVRKTKFPVRYADVILLINTFITVQIVFSWNFNCFWYNADFYQNYERNLFKTLWEKKKMIVTSIIIHIFPMFSTPQKDNTIQYNTIQYNTIQYNTIQYILLLVRGLRPKIQIILDNISKCTSLLCP